ncbi:DUF6339 family protein [Guptibacillus hwajinpoensis]|uniref:DUF6339 family protein n=1 Tax=Guptibacillus hwajinpoensis TaxID=208199 RepID=UPI0024B382FD|nr:DUF6339 family protein [Pseudalkalibacillus hwajinpoensis]
MTIYRFTTHALSVFKTSILTNLEFYLSSENWIKEYWNNYVHEGDDWFTPINTSIENKTLKLIKSSGANKAEADLLNTKMVYELYKDIPLDLATDERFWAYLTHIVYPEYIKDRWINQDREEQEIVSAIQEHYFFKTDNVQGDRQLVRNGISRLWWYGHITYDETRLNKFELTEYLLQIIDFIQQFTERSYSRNPEVVKNILSILKDDLNFNPKGNNGRYTYRKIFRDLNLIGGVKVIDFMDREDLRDIIYNSMGKEIVYTDKSSF